MDPRTLEAPRLAWLQAAEGPKEGLQWLFCRASVVGLVGLGFRVLGFGE